MSKKTRRILFYYFFFLFIIVGLGTVFYSQGWRINIENCSITKLFNCSIKFQKTGAIFIETNPKGITIKIDGKTFQDKSGLIQSGTLITNLLPKTYKITIEKDGYLPWQKKLLIEPAKVAEILGVILIPKNFQKQLIAITKPIDKFWINTDQKIIFKSSGALYYFQSPPLSKLRGDKFIKWDDDGNKVILQDSKTQTYYLYELNNLSKFLNISAIFNNFERKSVITDVAFHPFESSRLIIRSKNGLYLFDLNRLKFETILKEPVFSWTIKNSNIYYIKEAKNQIPKTKSYQLASFNLILKTESILTALSISGAEMTVSGNKIAMLADNGELYIFDQENQALTQIAHSAKKFTFSPDRKKIVFFDKDGKLNIYFVEDYRMGINKKAGEIISLSHLGSAGLTIQNIFWHKNSHHLFIEYTNGKIDFVEIDDRLPINQYTLIENADKFYYDPNLNRSYFIQNNALYFFESF